jgi:phosphatidylinositol alpha-1,6-mannosyltransferase
LIAVSEIVPLLITRKTFYLQVSLVLFSVRPLKTPVIFITHEFPPRRGGISTYVLETALALSKSGMRDVSLWHGGPPPSDRFCLSLPFQMDHIPNKGSLNWPCLWQTARFVKSRHQAILDSTVCIAEPGPIFAYLYASLLGLPLPKNLVLVLHGSEILRLAAWRHRRMGFRQLLSKATVIGVVSAYTRSLLNKYFPGHEKRTVLVPGALRSDFLPPTSRSRPANDPNDLRVLTVARMHPRKGFHHVIESLGKIPNPLKERVSYTIIAPQGNERYRQNLISRAQQLDLQFNCKQDDSQLKQDYANADIFAMTSDELPQSVESFGLVYLEASASGLPIVANNIGGVPEAVWHNETGYLVQPDDPDGLTTAFHKLLSDPGLRRRMGEKGRNRAQLLSWEANAAKLFDKTLD